MELSDLATPEDAASFLAGGGELGELMRARDWSASLLGPPQRWPQSLRSVVGLLLNSKFPMFVAWGAELGFLYNDPYSEILGDKHPDALGGRFQDIWHEIWPDISPLIDAALAGEATYREDLPLVMRRRGYDEQTWFTFSYSPVRDESGAVAGMFCACTETTGKVLAERKTAAELERLGEMFRQAPGAMAVLSGPTHRFDIVNPAYERLVGRSSLIGKSVAEALPEVVEQGFVELLDRVYASGEPYVGRRVPVALDRRGNAAAEDRLVDFVFQPISSDGGATTGVFVQATDVTEGAEAEAELRESEARFRLMADAVPQIVWIVNAHGQNEFYNRQWYQYTGAPEEPIDVSGVADRYLHPDDRDATLAAFQEAQQTGTTFEVEHRIRSATGEYRWFLVRGEPHCDAGGEIVRWYGASVDIHDRRSAAALLSAIGDAAADLIFAKDRQCRMVYANAATARTIGRPAAEVVGLGNDAITSSKTEARTLDANDLRVMESGVGEIVEEAFTSPDGTTRIFRSAKMPMRDTAGNVIGLAGVSSDVTEHKAAEQALRESEARLRALTDHLPGGMVYQISTGPDGMARRFLYVSQSHEALTGIPADQVLADPTLPYSLIHPEDQPRLVEAEAEAIRTLGVFDVQARFRRSDGELRWCRIISAPRQQTDGSLIWDGIQIDITDQKESEAKLRESDERFQAITNSIDQMIWSTRPDGFHDYFNRRWYEYTGVPEGSTDGQAWNGIFHPEDQDRAWEAWRRSLESGETYQIQYRLRHRSGEYRWVLGRAQPVRGADGRITRWFGTCTDIEEIVQAREVLARSREELETLVEERTEALLLAQEQLRQSQKLEAMGQLTGGVAHDFNNLLTPIVGSLDLLQRRGVGGEREQRMIDGALQSAERAKTLVQRLLAFARRQPLQPRPVDVGSLVRGMADLVASTSGPQVKVAVDIPDDLPAATADPNQLEMAILNLSVNARDAMPDGGTLTISAGSETVGSAHRLKLKPGAYVRLSVADTGVGMDQATIARAIEPFFSTKGIGKGTGLGLSMVHGLASQLGGTLSISSRPGLGTSIELWLPASAHPAEAGGEEAEDVRAPKPAGAALLVDDEELPRASTADMLSDLGYEVIEASSAEQALRVFDSGANIDLLVTDHLMPGMTGADLARELRQRRPRTPVLIISGFAEMEGLASDLPRLAKPFRQADLAAKLAELTAA